MNIVAIAFFVVFAIHRCARHRSHQIFHARRNLFWSHFFEFRYPRFIFFFGELLIKNTKTFSVQSDASEAVFRADTIKTVIAVDRIFTVVAIIAVVALYAIDALETKFTLIAERAVDAIATVKNAVIIQTVFRLVARERHVAVFAFFGVLAVGAVFVLHNLQPDVWNFLAEQLELFKKVHGRLRGRPRPGASLQNKRRRRSARCREKTAKKESL